MGQFFNAYKILKLIILFGLFILNSNIFIAQNYEVKIASFSSTKMSEYAPSFCKDGISFSVSKKHDSMLSVSGFEIENQLHIINDLVFYPDLEEFKTSDQFPFIINKEYKTNVVLNPGEDILVFSSEMTLNSSNKNIRLGLFQSQKKNGVWEDASLISFVEPTSNYTHPAWSNDGKTLYFVSDKKGGYGGMDIWSTTISNGRWSEAINLGSDLNTRNNEVFPFINKKNVLYFSSDRPGGIGGMDIYLYNLEKKAVSKIPQPVNSNKNEWSFISKEGQNGFLCSDRNGSDDIFTVSKIYDFPENCYSGEYASKCYIFYDLEPLPDSIHLIQKWTESGKTIGYGDSIRYCFPSTGTYTVEMSLLDTTINYEINNVASYQVEIRESTLHHLEIIHDNHLVFSKIRNNTNELVKDESIYWEWNGDVVNEGYEFSLNKSSILPGSHQLRVSGMKEKECLEKEIIINCDPKVFSEYHVKPKTSWEGELISEEFEALLYQALNSRKVEFVELSLSENENEKCKAWCQVFSKEFESKFDVEVKVQARGNTSITKLILR